MLEKEVKNMIQEINNPLVQEKIYAIAVSRTAKNGVPEKAKEVASEVIVYRQAENDQQTAYRRFNTPIDQGRLPKLSELGMRVNFLSGLALSYEERVEAIKRHRLARNMSSKSM